MFLIRSILLYKLSLFVLQCFFSSWFWKYYRNYFVFDIFMNNGKIFYWSFENIICWIGQYLLEIWFSRGVQWAWIQIKQIGFFHKMKISQSIICNQRINLHRILWLISLKYSINFINWQKKLRCFPYGTLFWKGHRIFHTNFLSEEKEIVKV